MRALPLQEEWRSGIALMIGGAIRERDDPLPSQPYFEVSCQGYPAIGPLDKERFALMRWTGFWFRLATDVIRVLEAVNTIALGTAGGRKGL
jgi:hypothetical protein